MPEPEKKDKKIEIGLASKLGVAMTGVLAVGAAVSAVAGGDNGSETVASLIGAVVTAMTLMIGRYGQSIAQVKADAGPAAGGASASAPPAAVVPAVLEVRIVREDAPARS